MLRRELIGNAARSVLMKLKAEHGDDYAAVIAALFTWSTTSQTVAEHLHCQPPEAVEHVETIVIESASVIVSYVAKQMNRSFEQVKADISLVVIAGHLDLAFADLESETPGVVGHA